MARISSIIVGSLLFLVSAAVADVTVTKVSVQNLPDRVQVTVQANGAVQYKTAQYNTRPHAYCVDIPGIFAPRTRFAQSVSSGGVYKVLATQFTKAPRPNIVRISVTARAGFSSQVSPGGAPNTLIFTVWKNGAKPADSNPSGSGTDASLVTGQTAAIFRPAKIKGAGLSISEKVAGLVEVMSESEPHTPTPSSASPEGSAVSRHTDPPIASEPLVELVKGSVETLGVESAAAAEARKPMISKPELPPVEPTLKENLVPRRSRDLLTRNAASVEKVMSYQERLGTQGKVIQTASASFPSPNNSITVDFVDTEIIDVIKAISVQAGVDIICGPEVTGKVTLTLTNATLDEVLDSITKLNGLYWKRHGNRIMVASAETLAKFGNEAAAENLPARKWRVVWLHHLKATEAVKILSTILPSGPTFSAVASPDPGGVVIPAPSQGGGASSGSQAPATPTAGAGLVPVSERILVYGSDGELAQAEEIIEQLDKLPDYPIESYTFEKYRCKNISAEDAAAQLGKLLPNLTVQVIPDTVTPLNNPAETAVQSTGGANGGSGTSSGGAGAGGGTTGAAQGSAGSGTEVTLQPRKMANSNLLLMGPEKSLARAKELLSTLDVAPPQILIEVTFTDLKNDSSLDLGLEYAWPDPVFTASENSVHGDFRFGRFSRNTTSYDVTLNALAKQGKAKILANPKVAVLEKQTATIFIGDRILYAYVSNVSQGVATYTIAEQNVGINLNVTPSIGDDGMIEMHLRPYVSSISGYLRVNNVGDFPQIRTREATTTVRVRDGESIVIGGLINENEVKNLSKVPILGDIPLFGELFKNRSNSKNRSEIVIVITARIMK